MMTPQMYLLKAKNDVKSIDDSKFEENFIYTDLTLVLNEGDVTKAFTRLNVKINSVLDAMALKKMKNINREDRNKVIN